MVRMYCPDCNKKTEVVSTMTSNYCLECYPEKKCPDCGKGLAYASYCTHCFFEGKSLIKKKTKGQKIPPKYNWWVESRIKKKIMER